MATQPTTVLLDRAKIAEGLGELKDGQHYGRILGPDGKTLVYVKKESLAVPAELVKGAPKKLGTFTPEKNGKWATVPVADMAAARAIIEFVSAKAAEKAEAAA